MAVNSIEERKRYISEVRSSFGDPKQSQRYGRLDQPGEKQEARPASGSLVLRAVIAAVIFAAFLYCDRNKVSVNNVTTQILYEKLQESLPVEKWIQSAESML